MLTTMTISNSKSRISQVIKCFRKTTQQMLLLSRTVDLWFMWSTHKSQIKITLAISSLRLSKWHIKSTQISLLKSSFIRLTQTYSNKTNKKLMCLMKYHKIWEVYSVNSVEAWGKTPRCKLDTTSRVFMIIPFTRPWAESSKSYCQRCNISPSCSTSLWEPVKFRKLSYLMLSLKFT